MTWTDKGADDEYSEILIRAVHERVPALAEHLDGSGSTATTTSAQWRRGPMDLFVSADFSRGALTATLFGAVHEVSYNADGEMEIVTDSYHLVPEDEVRFPTEYAFSKDAFVEAAHTVAARLCEPDTARILERFFRQPSGPNETPPAKAEP